MKKTAGEIHTGYFHERCFGPGEVRPAGRKIDIPLLAEVVRITIGMDSRRVLHSVSDQSDTYTATPRQIREIALPPVSLLDTGEGALVLDARVLVGEQ